MASPPRVEHFTVAERVARGKAARAEVPRSSHAHVGARAAPARSRSSCSRSRRRRRVPELVPIRYGRMLVSPFTFYRGAAYLMASDLADRPAHRAAHPALRRCPPLELRRLRCARPAARLRHQRLRRDAPRAVRVGRQASRRELRRRGPRPGLRRRDATRDQHRRSCARTGRRSPSFARDAQPRRLVRAPRHRRPRRPLRVRGESPSSGSGSRRTWRRPGRRTACKAFGKLTRPRRRRATDRRRSRHSSTPFADLVPETELHREHELIRGVLRSYRRTLVGRSPQAARALPLRRRGAQGRRGRQRRHARLHHAAARAR